MRPQHTLLILVLLHSLTPLPLPTLPLHLALLPPLTILLQPQEVMDAAERLAYLALSDPAMRPMESHSYANSSSHKRGNGGGGSGYGYGNNNQRTPSKLRNFTLRHYDAVGPETLTIRDLLERFALYR